MYLGTLEIPVLELELPIISQWSDSLLKIAPCRYQGSAYLDNMILAGHNYRAHFAGLKNLQIGDSVIFTDAEGSCFHYEVVRLGGTSRNSHLRDGVRRLGSDLIYLHCREEAPASRSAV